jgi:hypothetical protein
LVTPILKFLSPFHSQTKQINGKNKGWKQNEACKNILEGHCLPLVSLIVCAFMAISARFGRLCRAHDYGYLAD